MHIEGTWLLKQLSNVALLSSQILFPSCSIKIGWKRWLIFLSHHEKFSFSLGRFCFNTPRRLRPSFCVHSDRSNTLSSPCWLPSSNLHNTLFSCVMMSGTTMEAFWKRKQFWSNLFWKNGHFYTSKLQSRNKEKVYFNACWLQWAG